jgi:hypothetical protein
LTAAQVQRLIRELGDEEFTVREKAEADLIAHRWEVGAALETAAKSSELQEIRNRAQTILDKHKPAPPTGPDGRVLRFLSPDRPADRELLKALAAGVRDNPVCAVAREKLEKP